MNETHSDPPVDEIRQVRQRISAQFNHDPERLVAYYITLQERYRERLLDTSKTEDTDHSAA